MNIEDIKGKVDFGIITIREDEYSALLQRFPTHANLDKNNYYSIHTMAIEDSEYVIALLRSPEQGNLAAMEVANDLITDLDPSWLLVVGIGGGYPETEFTLGDVVISTRLHDFSVSASLENKPPEFANQGGPMVKRIQTFVANLQSRQDKLNDWNEPEKIGLVRPEVNLSDENFYGDDAWKKKAKRVMNSHFGPTSSARKPKYTSASVVSSGTLVKSPTLIEQWHQTARDLKVVEMELAGVYRAAQKMDYQYPVLAIRGISDIVGFERDGAWTNYACHSAASFTEAFLKLKPVTPKKTALLGNKIFDKETTTDIQDSQSTFTQIVGEGSVAIQSKQGIQLGDINLFKEQKFDDRK